MTTVVLCCCSYLGSTACPSTAQVLSGTVDGTGLQRWTLTYIPNSDALYVPCLCFLTSLMITYLHIAWQATVFSSSMLSEWLRCTTAWTGS